MRKKSFKKSILHYVIIEKTISVHHGRFKLLKCYMIIKTIYYKNAVVKIYDVPVFYIPRLSHPDPTVDRRSGFLPPTFTDTKNLGFGTSIPYFFAINNDKNFTLTSNFYNTENPCFWVNTIKHLKIHFSLPTLDIQKVIKN